MQHLTTKQQEGTKLNSNAFFWAKTAAFWPFFELIAANEVRDGVKKSKWKFKMAFAMKGGGSRGGLECHLPILKNDFFKNHLESFPDCENVFCT